MKTPYDYTAALQTLVDKGRQLYGPGYRIPDLEMPAVLKLLCWFLGDEQSAAAYGVSLQKGLLLSGPVGCGKSAVINILRALCKPRWAFSIVPCHMVALSFANDGHLALEKYTTRCWRNNRPHTICFDDLGFESNAAHFGNNNINVMLQVLAMRYDLFIHQGMLTHVTTNLNSEELEARYGNRIRSRMREMFNLIAYPAGSTDKRT
ncbi:MAG TPA: hypothetical protein VFS25_05270 [Chitinophaga sp.]|uniref:hypothetical protein n=1 Tax=Chitinophaga sp. TaxID=1869181 RepID=UPI002DB7E145|nr:hypothetical protein [Chitinophaga sp.]HEU4552218.1 hypothetical protein [Chitinophaga sp.]